VFYIYSSVVRSVTYSFGLTWLPLNNLTLVESVTVWRGRQDTVLSIFWRMVSAQPSWIGELFSQKFVDHFTELGSEGLRDWSWFIQRRPVNHRTELGCDCLRVWLRSIWLLRDYQWTSLQLRWNFVLETIFSHWHWIVNGFFLWRLDLGDKSWIAE